MSMAAESRASAGSAPSVAADPAAADRLVVATSLAIAADDFVVDAYVNGQRLPDSARALAAEVHGATGERIQASVREGDWLVFNVVNNRLRWGGACYFALTGLADDGAIGFVSEVSDQWSVCDDPGQAPRFIREQNYLSDRRAQPIENPWSGGTKMMSKLVSGWSGQPIWGAPTNRNIWLKFIVPGAR